MLLRDKTLVPDGYLPRIVDAQIDRYLRVFGTVEVADPKWCGKTWSLLVQGASVVYMVEGANTSTARADPSLAVALLGMGPDALIRDWQTFGLVFENLAIRDLRTYAMTLPDIATVPVRYYPDDTALEANAITELADGRWAAFEVKLSEDKVDEGLRGLRRLKRKLTARPSSRTRPPEFVAVVVGISEFAREVDAHEYVIPLRCLGA